MNSGNNKVHTRHRAFWAGAAIGSAITLLFTTKRGDNSRQWLKSKASELIGFLGCTALL